MNYYIHKFLKEHFLYENEDAYNYIINYCMKCYNQPKKISELIILGLSKVYMDYYAKDLSVPFKTICEGIEAFIGEVNQETVNNNRFKKEKISDIQIKNFKGFGCVSKEDNGIRICLHNNKNIFFGSNGSGKTSFCEALEYKLTGNIKEAKKRGIKEKQYFKRADGEKEVINISFNTEGLSLIDITEYEKSEFNKCFIEKNRINEFALLRGHKDTGVKANDVTARLLGFELFDDFKSKFVSDKQFKTRVESLLKKKSIQDLRDLNNLNTSYIEQYKNNKEKINKKEYQNLLKIDHYITERETFLEVIKSKIRCNNHKKYVKKDVYIWLWKLRLNLRRLERINKKLGDKSKELDLSELYKAIIKLKENTDVNICPACKTPVTKTVENPFDYSDKEIIKLKEISILKDKKKEITLSLTTSYWEVVIEFKRNYEYSSLKSKSLSSIEIEQILEIFNSINDEDERLKILSNILTEDKTIINDYLQVLEVEVNKDSSVDKLKKLIVRKQNDLAMNKKKNTLEISKYRNLYIQQKDLFLKLSRYKEKKQKLKKVITKDEKYNIFLNELIICYGTFIKDLSHYILKEQNELILKIRDRILGYYNEVNRGDSQDEKIKNINFKEESDKTYTIELERNDGWKNAGVILSEGHLRVLGLSIILSIAESSSTPFIIFDDVVNAIDSEHRANIIEMFFSNRYLKKTQLIVTTHDRLFWERFCNTYSSKINKKGIGKISSCFKYQNNSVHYIPYTISYEDKINEALKFYDIRQALVYLRIWFESICFEYCKRKEEKLEGYFSTKQHEKPTHLIVSITAVYDKIIKRRFNESKHLKIITENLNWNFLNQEHHSFDENIFNISHSTTSNEVQKIFDALKGFHEEVNDSFVVTGLIEPNVVISETTNK